MISTMSYGTRQDDSWPVHGSKDVLPSAVVIESSVRTMERSDSEGFMWAGGGASHDVEEMGLLVRPTSLVFGYVVIAVRLRNLTASLLSAAPGGPLPDRSRTLKPITNPITPEPVSHACDDGDGDDASTHRKYESLKGACVFDIE